jgi:hypothetical protein
LCIVQDDIVDWEDHVKVMADIYRDAYITLAVGASEDDDGGFFRDHEDIYTDLRSFMVADGETKCEIYLRRCLPHPDEGWPGGTVMPLMSRGWVFQERLLSRRFLCFARNEILWECQEDVACSCSTSDTGFNHRVPGAKPGFLNCWAAKFEFAAIFQLPKNNLWSLWRDVVTRYSRRELTYPHDKMPALAGLAMHFEAAGAGTYLYGLWLEAFETHFLWVNRGFSEHETCPRNAPSWSWISAADGCIDWLPYGLGNSGWKVMSVSVRDTVTSMQYNDSSLLPLKVRGNVSHVSLELGDPNDRMGLGYRSVYLKPAPSATSSLVNPLTGQGHVAADLPSSESTEEMTSQKYDGGFWADYKFWTDENSLWNLLENVCFLETGIENHDKPSDIDDVSPCWVTGLLLRATDPEANAVIPTFERIGHLRFCTNTSEDQWKPLGADTTFFFV